MRVSNTFKELKSGLAGFKESLIFEHLLITDKNDESKIKEFLCIFDSVKDTRVLNMCTYTTKQIIIIVFLAILDERKNWSEIEDFGDDHILLLRKIFDDDEFIGPSHDTICRVFSLIDPKTLEKGVVAFLQAGIRNVEKAIKLKKDKNTIKQIAMDGKELRGSGRKYETDEKVRNSQIMHFYDTDTQICLSSELIDNKHNEIPMARKIIKILNLRNVLVSSDALHAQVETIALLHEKGAHYVIGLKGNQKDLFTDCTVVFAKHKKKNKKDYFKMGTEKSHNQVEIREFYKLPSKLFYGHERFESTKNIILYHKEMFNVITKKEHFEDRYYITDLNDIELIAEAIRNHWMIENSLHWHLDTTFNEDANTTMNKRAALNLSILNKSALSLIKLMSPILLGKSIRRSLKSFRSNLEHNLVKLLYLLSGQDIEKIILTPVSKK